MATASGGEAIGRRHGVNRRPSGCVLTPRGRRPYEEGDGLTQTPGMCAHRGGRGGTRQKAVSASEERDLGGGDQSLDFDLGLPASKCDNNNFLCLSRPSKHTRQQRWQCEVAGPRGRLAGVCKADIQPSPSSSTLRKRARPRWAHSRVGAVTSPGGPVPAAGPVERRTWPLPGRPDG